MNARTGSLRRAPKATHERQRIDVTTGQVLPSAKPEVGTNQTPRTFAINQLDVEAALLPLLEAALRECHPAGSMRGLDPAVLNRRTLNSMLACKLEQRIPRPADKTHQRLALLRTERFRDHVGVGSGHRGNDLAVVASRCPPPYLRGFQHDHTRTAFRRMQRRTQARETAANHNQISSVVTRSKGVEQRSRERCVGP